MKALRIMMIGLAVVGLLSGCATVTRQYNAWSEYQTGLSLFRSGKYAEAHEHAKAALAQLPDRPEFLALVGWTFFKQSRIEEARRLFTRVNELESKGVAGPQGLAWVDYMQGKYGTSEKWFKRQLEWAIDHMGKVEWPYYSPQDMLYVHSIRSDAAYGLGLVALAQGRRKEAEAFLTEAHAYPNSFTGHAPVFTALGDLCSAGKDYTRAMAYYDKALAMKEDAGTVAKRAWCLYSLGDKSGADQSFLRLASSSGDRRPGLYGLVFTRHALGKVGEAKEYLKDLIRLDPYTADTTLMYGLIIKTEGWKLLWEDFAEAYFEKGDFERASYKLQGYLPLKKNDCSASLMNAWCIFYLKGPKSGLQEFTRLAQGRTCPDDQVRTGKGVSLLYAGSLAEADAELEKAARENPQNLRAHVARGAVAYLKGDYAGAIRIYEKYLEQLPKNEKFFSWPSHALNNLGWSYIKTGKYREAMLTFQRLKGLHHAPAYPEIFDGLGWALYHLHHLEEAKAAFEQGLLLSPGYASSVSGLAAVNAKIRRS